MTHPFGPRRSRAWPLIVVLLIATALASAGTPAAADGNESPTGVLAFRSITAGNRHSCGLSDDGTVRCWGGNFAGQLGRGNTDSWGELPGQRGGQLPPVDLGTDRTATAISAGGDHTCALLDDGTVKCWGSNGSGELGQTTSGQNGDEPGEMGDDLPPIALGTGHTATAIAAGFSHSCALLEDGTVKCWGSNLSGQLGYGNTSNIGLDEDMGDNLSIVALGAGREATAITAGDGQTCALLDDGSVKCWGDNDKGRLGQGDQADRGDEPGEMGDSLLPVALGTDRTATAISTGYGHVCAILDDDTLKCWGENSEGRLGLGDTNHRGDAPGEMGDALPVVDLGAGRTAVGIAAGDDGTCALLDDALVKCWGSNGFGQVGVDDGADRGDASGEMGDDLPTAVLGRHVTAVTGGGIHFCARLDNSQVKCWGWNQTGQLGVGNTETQGDESGEMAALPVTIALHPVFRPDGRIRLGSTRFFGNDVYNRTGAGQSRSTRVPAGGRATFTIAIQNDGNFTDGLRVLGQPTTGRFTVTYRRGAANITARVVAGTYTLAGVPAGAIRDITVTIQAKAGTPAGATISRTVQTRSVTRPSIRDTVKATVTRR
jgi:alpha-tubulin suppressor-like RCC1 family protein